MSCNHSYHSLSYDVNEMNIEYAQGCHANTLKKKHCHAKGKNRMEIKRYV